MTLTNTNRRVLTVIVGLLIATFIPQIAGALTLKTTPSEPSLQGKQIKAEIRVAAAGVQQEADYPLDPVSGTVGETFEMGSLDSESDRRVDLRVELPWGQYYREVSPDELSEGTIDLTVYPQGDNSGLEISRHGILVQPFPKRLMAREYIVIENNSQSMAGGSSNPLQFELPEGVDRIIPGPGMGDEGEMTATADGYEYTNLVPPGESMIGFFYMIQPGSSTYTFERSATLPTRRFAVRVPSFEKLDVSVDGLEKAPDRSRGQDQPSEHTPQIYRTSDLQPGDSIRMTFDGLDEISPPGGMQGQGQSGPEASPESPSGEGVDARPSSFSNVSWPLILGIAFSVIIFVGSYGYVQYKLARGPDAGVDQDFLIREIANLDQEYDDGAIDEAFYKRTRRRWKQKAEEVSDDQPS